MAFDLDSSSGPRFHFLALNLCLRIVPVNPVPQEQFMPVDTSKNPSRRTVRKVINEEDVGLKRARGEMSCAECRRSSFIFFFKSFSLYCTMIRLKLKCDKKVPCGSCVRRGCPTICPNGPHSSLIANPLNIDIISTGSLSTGQGTRYILFSRPLYSVF